VIKTSVGLVYLLTCLLEPFMPSFSNEVLRQLNLSLEENLSFSDEKGEIVKAKTPWDFLPAGHKIGRPTPLFEELVRLAFRIFLSVGHNFTPHNLQ
jgi:methionyl-tRNA synthetase